MRPLGEIAGILADAEWEIVCPDCGDADDLTLAELPATARAARGPCRSELDALTALDRHRGERTPRTIQADARRQGFTREYGGGRTEQAPRQP